MYKFSICIYILSNLRPFSSFSAVSLPTYHFLALSLFKSTLNTLHAACVHMSVGSSNGTREASRGHNLLSLSSSHQLPVPSQLQVRLCESLLHLGVVHTAITVLSPFVRRPCHVLQTLSLAPDAHYFWTLISPQLFSVMVPEPCEE